jgi:ankyrin repeat protein
MGLTPLHLAVGYGNYEIALWLYSVGADITIKNKVNDIINY